MREPRAYIRYARYAVQLAFVGLAAWIGVECSRWAYALMTPGAVTIADRPAGVEAFLPIGGFMAVKYYVATFIMDPARAILDPFHPAGMFIFLSAIFVSAVARKGFCGWICPVGTLSEWLWKLGRKVMGSNRVMPPKADMGMKSIKYILAFTFVFFIMIMQTGYIVLYFISDYYRTVDVRMLLMFTDMSMVAAIAFSALAALSVLYRNFWCRYLCPYGALTGVAAYLSPFRIRRNEEACIHCKACTRHCPSQIDVEAATEPISTPECFGCLTCISPCPVGTNPSTGTGALDLATDKGKGSPMRNLIFYPAIVVAAFYLIIALAMLSGNWQTRSPITEYERIVPGLIDPSLAPAETDTTGQTDSDWSPTRKYQPPTGE